MHFPHCYRFEGSNWFSYRNPTTHYTGQILTAASSLSFGKTLSSDRTCREGIIGHFILCQLYLLEQTFTGLPWLHCMVAVHDTLQGIFIFASHTAPTNLSGPIFGRNGGDEPFRQKRTYFLNGRLNLVFYGNFIDGSCTSLIGLPIFCEEYNFALFSRDALALNASMSALYFPTGLTPMGFHRFGHHD